MTVAETPTNLTITSTEVENGVISVSGLLASNAGVSLDDRPVFVNLDESSIGAVRTESNGKFSVTLDMAGTLQSNSERTTRQLLVGFDGEGLDLAGARDRTRVIVSTGNTDRSSNDLRRFAARWPFAIAGTVLLVVLLVAVYRNRRDTTGDSSRTTEDSGGGEPFEPPSPSGVSELATAEELLDAGDTDAVVSLAYSVTRDLLSNQVNRDAEGTHWEFLQTYRGAESNDERREAVELLSSMYERAAFAPASVSHEDARESLDVAIVIVSSDPITLY